MIEALAFYMFAGLLLISGALVITARNAVHSVLFLILGFFNAAGLFVLLGAEFLAMILVIVYVGAVAVLFLFVVMMLDMSSTSLKKTVLHHLPVGAAVGIVLLCELIALYTAWTFMPEAPAMSTTPTPDPELVTNTHAIGEVLYTDYVYLFQAAGLILLVAMIGAITLTHRVRPGVRKQNITGQVSRTRSDAIEIHKVTPGTGV